MTVAYDITRLALRLLSRAPNGIDRVDFLLGGYFFAESQLNVGILGLRPSIVSAIEGRRMINAVQAQWGEDLDLGKDMAYQRVLAQLMIKGKAAQPVRVLHIRRRFQTPPLLYRHIFRISPAPRSRLERGAAYLNVSQFPLWSARHFAWLRERRDVKAVFFIHDLLPLAMPENFRGDEYERHRQRLDNVARFATGAIVASDAVRSALDDHMRLLRRADLPIHVAPIPPAPIFFTPPIYDPHLARVPYFVCCGTLEPRKNHMLLLRVWRALIARFGENTPKLILVGKRGWHYRSLIEDLEAMPLCTHIIEVSGLTSPALKTLLDNGRGLLMPSLAEGYGLPVREGLACGTPVVASDIPVFRDIESDWLTRLGSNDDEAWLARVAELSALDVKERHMSRPDFPRDPEKFQRSVSDFLHSL